MLAQAATLELYDPDRSRAPTLNNQIVSVQRLGGVIAAIRERLDERQGQGLRLLIGTSTSPTLARLLGCVTKRWPRSKWAIYEPFTDDLVRAGMALAYGQQAAAYSPIYDFSHADVVLSIDDDFFAFD